jgi:hypothetical protein
LKSSKKKSLKFYLSTPRASDTQYKLGDFVWLDFGISGKVGPCKVNTVIETEEVELYGVVIPVEPGHDFELGYFTSDYLLPYGTED